MCKADIVTGRNFIIQRVINILPKRLRLMFNPRRKGIEEFMKKTSRKLKAGQSVLDAGAGPCPYKKMFNHCKYESTDISDPHKILSFTCSLDKIPIENNHYDALIATEVLEHVQYPNKVVAEFYRVLKKKGRVFLTAPQGWMVHQEPYNFYYFTRYGLKILFSDAGFRKINIEPIGGYFSVLADTIKFNNLLEQLKGYKFLYCPLRMLEFPFTQLFFPFILPLFDFLDRKRNWTLGYTLEAVK